MRSVHTPTHLHVYVSGAALVHVEVDYLWAQACLHLGIHLVAGLHQLLGQLHVVSRQAVMGPQGQGPRQETHQVILKTSNQRNSMSQNGNESAIKGSQL